MQGYWTPLCLMVNSKCGLNDTDLKLCRSGAVSPPLEHEVTFTQEPDSDWGEDITQEDDDSAGEDSVREIILSVSRSTIKIPIIGTVIPEETT